MPYYLPGPGPEPTQIHVNRTIPSHIPWGEGGWGGVHVWEGMGHGFMCVCVDFGLGSGNKKVRNDFLEVLISEIVLCTSWAHMGPGGAMLGPIWTHALDMNRMSNLS